MSTVETTNETIILQIAQVTHEANRAFCEANNDLSQLPWAEAPEWQRDSAINGIKFHMKNPNAQPEDSHNSWMLQKIHEGWIYGEVKNPETKEHPCMVPYNELPVQQQMKDYIFGGIAKTMIAKYVATGMLNYERELTPGEATIGVGFNPSQREDVRLIKAKYAECYDLLMYHVTAQNNPAAGRLAAIAKTDLEGSAMWAVKALTR